MSTDHTSSCLLTDLFGRDLIDQRRPLSIAGHHEWRESLSEARPFDEVDAEIDDMTIVDPYEIHAPSRRSDKDLGAFLSLLDSLETGNDRKETTR